MLASPGSHQRCQLLAGGVRIFIDVGAHLGESLDIALDPAFGFARIYALEPASSCLRTLEHFRDRRVVVCPFGLSDEDSETDLFGAGLLGGSVFPGKQFMDPRSTDIVERVTLRRASTWLAEQSQPGDDIFLKLNCEGSECDILEDVIADPMVSSRIRGLYVEFDVRKIPSLAHRAEETREQLRRAGIQWVEPDEGEESQSALARWLRHALPASPVGLGQRLRYTLGLHRPPYVQARQWARRILPPRAFHALGSRLGVHGAKLRRLPPPSGGD